MKIIIQARFYTLDLKDICLTFFVDFRGQFLFSCLLVVVLVSISLHIGPLRLILNATQYITNAQTVQKCINTTVYTASTLAFFFQPTLNTTWQSESWSLGRGARQNSQSVVEFPRAVLMHIRGVGQVFVGRGHVDVLAPEHRLSNVERRLKKPEKKQGKNVYFLIERKALDFLSPFTSTLPGI